MNEKQPFKPVVPIFPVGTHEQMLINFRHFLSACSMEALIALLDCMQVELSMREAQARLARPDNSNPPALPPPLAG